MRVDRAWLCGLVGAGCVLVTGCAPRASTDGRNATAPAASPANAIASDPAAARSRATGVQVALVPLGSVPYDDFTLPLPSFDGAFIATQRGTAPSWPALLATPNAAPPMGAEVALYALAPGTPPRPIGTVAAPALLGRSADADGVLVEAPRPDGGRAIGHAAWFDASVEWLVDDGNVNAFAALGPNGAMAWSRRTRASRGFDLVVRHAGATMGVASKAAAGRDSVVRAEEGASFLFPTFTPDGGSVIAFELRDGVLRLATIDVAALPAGEIDAAASNPALRRTMLTDRGTAELAWQMRASMRGAFPGAGEPADSFLFVSPRPERVTIWSSERETGSFLAPGSLAACFLDADRVLVAFADRLALQTISTAEPGDARARADALDTILDGTYVPRPVAASIGSALLLAPRRGTVNVVALKINKTGRAGDVGGAR